MVKFWGYGGRKDGNTARFLSGDGGVGHTGAAPVLAAGDKGATAGVAKWAMAVSRIILGLRVEVSGLENVEPGKSYVYMANHLSFLDGPLLFYVIRERVRVILKRASSGYRLSVRECALLDLSPSTESG